MSDNLKNYLNAKSDEELVGMIAEEYADKGLSKNELVKAGMDGIAKARENTTQSRASVSTPMPFGGFVSGYFRPLMRKSEPCASALTMVLLT